MLMDSVVLASRLRVGGGETALGDLDVVVLGADAIEDVPHVAVVSVPVVVAGRLGGAAGFNEAVVGSNLSQLEDLLVSVVSRGSDSLGPDVVKLVLLLDGVGATSGVATGHAQNLVLDLKPQLSADGVGVLDSNSTVGVELIEGGEVSGVSSHKGGQHSRGEHCFHYYQRIILYN